MCAVKNEFLDQLREARKQLEKLRVRRCRMTHERVLIDRVSQLPVSAALPDAEFERVGLCSAAIRGVNAACSHTMARYQIKNALNILERVASFGDWRIEFDELNNAIHSLDHRKGDAEKNLARVIKKIFETVTTESANLNKERSLIVSQIAEMERQHSVYAEQIEKLKSKILAAVNSAIESEENELNQIVFGDT